MDLLSTDLLGTPAWMWLTFLATVLVLLVLDLGVLNRGNHEIGVARSLKPWAWPSAASSGGRWGLNPPAST